MFFLIFLLSLAINQSTNRSTNPLPLINLQSSKSINQSINQSIDTVNRIHLFRLLSLIFIFAGTTLKAGIVGMPNVGYELPAWQTFNFHLFRNDFQILSSPDGHRVTFTLTANQASSTCWPNPRCRLRTFPFAPSIPMKASESGTTFHNG